MKNYFIPLCFVFSVLLACNQQAEKKTPKGDTPQTSNAKTQISGELKQWHKITIAFSGPETNEHHPENPFLNYRLNVTFTNGDKSYIVPGYYAADGNAAETGANSGNQWRVHFCPDKTGEWTYTASFRKGREIAVCDSAEAGEPAAFDGETGTFTIQKTDKTGRDFRGKGKLQYVGEHYLKFAGNGEYFLKGGADSPENFLGYYEFDNTYYNGQRKARKHSGALHQYTSHEKDWNNGDPTWKDGKGKAIIGALNYLASQNMNSVYFLSMNVMGDGDDTWPWITPYERTRFDCSKLDQWEIVFSHMDSIGIMLHIVTQETENDALLDVGKTHVLRKLYYRELIARFAHHLAITWNLGEENGITNWSPHGQTVPERKAMAKYIGTHDPYKNFIAMHTHSSMEQRNIHIMPLLGFEYIDGPSLQIHPVDDVHSEVIKFRKLSVDSAKTWVVCTDEIGPAHTGAMPDKDDPKHDTIRHKVLWGTLMAGGAGVEWYFGYKHAHNDLNCEDWRSRENLWKQTDYALQFFHKHLPFHEMENHNELTTAQDDYCFAKIGEAYAVYLPNGGSTSLDLGVTDKEFSVKWYNPREGGGLLDGNVTTIQGPGKKGFGNPPQDDGTDWVVLIKRKE